MAVLAFPSVTPATVICCILSTRLLGLVSCRIRHGGGRGIFPWWLGKPKGTAKTAKKNREVDKVVFLAFFPSPWRPWRLIVLPGCWPWDVRAERP